MDASSNLISVDIGLLTFISGSLIPLLTGFVTKARASSRVKGLMNFGLSALTGAVTYALAHDGSFEPKAMLVAVVTTYLTSGVTYHNLWKPTGIAAAVQRVAPEVGVGEDSSPVPTPDVVAPPNPIPLPSDAGPATSNPPSTFIVTDEQKDTLRKLLDLVRQGEQSGHAFLMVTEQTGELFTEMIETLKRHADFDAPYVTTLRGQEVYRDPEGYLFVFDKLEPESDTES